MTKEEFDNIINLSIIDIIGEMDNGLAILFNLLINNKDSYEVLFWYNKQGDIILEPEERLLDKLNVSDIKEYDKLNDMAFIFYSNIPDPDGLLIQYLDEKN